MCETTALGVAIAAGNADGIRKWDVKIDAAVPSDTFLPSITENGKFNIFSNFCLIQFIKDMNHVSFRTRYIIFSMENGYRS